MVDTIPSLTLFHHRLSSSLPALLLLTHLNIPHTLISVTSDPFGHYTPLDPTLSREDFLALNPLGQVPTLALDYGLPGQAVITQLPAVLHYISSLRTGHGMLGRSPLEQAQVQEWMSYISATFTTTGFTYIFRPARIIGEAQLERVLQSVRDGGYEIVIAGLNYAESRFDDSGFAVGGHVTVVDFLLWTVCGWATKARLDIDRFPKLGRVLEKVDVVESVRVVLADERA
ncbi:hypothetical protein B0A48_01083 [Cryoendolithus antarcticus]|uniref:GST N-terminal domain-containing protein n=1 Tax=Cryoendolithus antarcticus TaxID=1507870 RepID=A0A1V8TSA4_9PEZI|nr:hypothetical protein B0A48_01083 [Cryoendolithus antarcticus]